MTPNFALSLSFDGLRLLQRVPGGWGLVGEVALDTADLNGALYVLRQTAEDYTRDGVATKLIIPNEQIRYLTVDTGDVDDAARWVAVRAALDGATPYAVDDLAFDMKVDGLKTRVAAVARETLQEAEGFAAAHGFNPVCYVATPGASDFPGEPFFGETALFKAEHGPGASVTPDSEIVAVIGPAQKPEPLEISETAAPEFEAAPGAPAEAETPAVDAVPLDADRPPPAPLLDEVPQELGSAPVLQETARDVEIEAPAAPSPEPVQGLGDTPGATEPADVPDAEPATAQAVFARKAIPDTDAPVESPDQDPEPEADPPFAIGFSSRRGNTPKLGGVTRPGHDARTGVAAPSIPVENDAPRTTPVPEPPQSAAASLVSPDPAARIEPVVTTPRMPAPQALPVGETAAFNEAERLTIFGARQDSGAAKPRFLGLVMTVVLLVLLAGVAAWASVFMDDGLGSLFRSRAAPEPAIASAPAEAPAAPTQAAPVPDTAPETTLASLAPAVPEARDEAPEPDAPPPRAAPAPGPAPDENSAEARYASSGIWIMAPVSPQPAALVPLDALYEPGIDRGANQRESRDAVALPRLASLQTDTNLLPQSSPAAPDVTFRLDARGLVIPTPDGAINPDGVLVIAGRPPLVPPPRPENTEILPEIDPAIAALAAFRPRARPDSLVEDTERANLGGLSRSELAAFRPVLRPKVERTEEEQQAEEPDAPATAQAVRVSLRPDARPRNFARIVARATPQAPASRPEATTTPARTIAPRTVTPKIPSSTSVTREATVRNAINLSRINLIGVYGKPSERRALVRLSNGRYQKVKVGDRLDGGQVSAIGDSELRYQKRGRNLVLRMPKG